jgi:hypothetical protein
MTNTQLLTPILTGGIKSVNFFNGRLLSAEDLRLEKKANKDARELLGQASGDGIVYGLEVREAVGLSAKQAPVLTVSEGLAVNREGETLLLQPSVNVALVRPAENGSATVNALFADCQPLQQTPNVVGKGVYLLTIQSASGVEGRAPVSGLGNIDAACNARYQIDGVQFRLIQLPVSATDLNDPAHLRNRLAYRCFGLNGNGASSFVANPFGQVVKKYGLLDDLRTNCLQDNEVPLAILSWTAANGIEFVDMWSVRRHMIRRSADAGWPLFVSDRRLAEGEAMFLQFQDQIESIRLAGQHLLSMVASTQLDYLPPAGLLPVADRGSSKDFLFQTFFQGVTLREPVHIEGALTRALLQEALAYPPIDLNGDEMLWLYWVRENVQAIDEHPAQSTPAYLMFVNGHLPYRGNARFDLNRWDYANFAE